MSYYSFGSFAWLSLQALALIIYPSFISSLLTPDYQRANCTRHLRFPSSKTLSELTPATPQLLSSTLPRSLGYSQLAIGLLVLALSGALPLSSSIDCELSASRNVEAKLTPLNLAQCRQTGRPCRRMRVR